MNYVDIAIIIVLGTSMLFGFSNGIVREVASLAALVVGVWGALKFSAFTAQKLYDFFDISGQYTDIIAFIITFLLIIIAIHFIGLIIDKFVNALTLGLLNKIFGAAFGILKSALILSVIFFIFNTIDAKKPFLPKGVINQSALYNPISDIVPSIFFGEKTFKQNLDRIKKNTNEISI
jgi:membrane protein required for colicin V production